ncbi:DUF2332 family protein [Aquamicrobium sp. LC103]|uniref:DUF2332 domain-containing protein n=1 Tax=Aquamicrobium sp. LC103 TaxID=1120658 RepID=UPI00063EA59A|nr:DUF2332 family protein [Aquamicrobium sp. LC103]TKT82864.1 DUF2332 family protein [Aquamicrobium sp. LC103]
MIPEEIARHFEQQAQACDTLGSPFTARLCRLLVELVDDTTRTGRRVGSWPGNPRADALALRLCGGLHALVLSGDDRRLAAAYPPNVADDERLAEAVSQALAEHDIRLLRALDSAPQTNEIARSAMLLPGFLKVAIETGLPLALCEIGASAGLNLLFDRFHYRYGDAQWGDEASPVRLSPETRGAPPPLSGRLEIAERNGCDITPIEVAKEADRLRLRSYVWPDQAMRLARLDAAISLTASVPFTLAKADAAAFVRQTLADRPKHAALVIYHSIMWQYMPRDTKDAVLAALAEAGEGATGEAPIARLRMEPRDPNDGWATLSVTTWPGGETRRLAKCDFHGRWIEWTG